MISWAARLNKLNTGSGKFLLKRKKSFKGDISPVKSSDSFFLSKNNVYAWKKEEIAKSQINVSLGCFCACDTSISAFSKVANPEESPVE